MIQQPEFDQASEQKTFLELITIGHLNLILSYVNS